MLEGNCNNLIPSNIIKTLCSQSDGKCILNFYCFDKKTENQPHLDDKVQFLIVDIRNINKRFLLFSNNNSPSSEIMVLFSNILFSKFMMDWTVRDKARHQIGLLGFQLRPKFQRNELKLLGRVLVFLQVHSTWVWSNLKTWLKNSNFALQATGNKGFVFYFAKNKTLVQTLLMNILLMMIYDQRVVIA